MPMETPAWRSAEKLHFPGMSQRQAEVGSDLSFTIGTLAFCASAVQYCGVVKKPNIASSHAIDPYTLWAFPTHVPYYLRARINREGSLAFSSVLRRMNMSRVWVRQGFGFGSCPNKSIT